MKKARIILLCILIPLFIASIAFYYIYNLPTNKLQRQFKSIIKSQGDLKEYIQKIVSLDSERFNFENQQKKKVFEFIENQKQEYGYDRAFIKDFIIKNIDVIQMSKYNKTLIAELQLFRDKIRRSRELLEQLNLKEMQKNISEYQELTRQLKRSLSFLTYFVTNYQAALDMNQTFLDDFENSILVENQEFILKPMDRYFKHAKNFKDLFDSNYQYTLLLFKNIRKKTKSVLPSKPQEKDIQKITENLVSEKYQVIEKIKEDVNDDAVDELILLLFLNKTETNHQPTYLMIFKWENSSYKKVWEKNLDEIVFPASKGPALVGSKIFLRYSGLIPEIVVLTGIMTNPVISFRYDGDDYKKVFP